MAISFPITKMLAFIRCFYFLTHFVTHKWVWSAVQLPPDLSEEKKKHLAIALQAITS